MERDSIDTAQQRFVSHGCSHSYRYDLKLTQRVQLCLALRKSLRIRCINQKHNPVHLGEIVAPQSTGLHVATEVISRELDITDRQFFRCCTRCKKSLEIGREHTY